LVSKSPGSEGAGAEAKHRDSKTAAAKKYLLFIITHYFLLISRPLIQNIKNKIIAALLPPYINRV
jgi:hypothetical protein